MGKWAHGNPGQLLAQAKARAGKGPKGKRVRLPHLHLFRYLRSEPGRPLGLGTQPDLKLRSPIPASHKYASETFRHGWNSGSRHLIKTTQVCPPGFLFEAKLITLALFVISALRRNFRQGEGISGTALSLKCISTFRTGLRLMAAQCLLSSEIQWQSCFPIGVISVSCKESLSLVMYR